MPEPGITDRNFNDPTSDRQKPRRRKSRSRLQIPREYAGFQLEDGRALVDVMGESFFPPEGGSGGAFEGNPRFSQGPASAKRTLDRGNALISGTSSEQAKPDGDNEAEFRSLSFGLEEDGAEVSVTGLPKPGRRPAGFPVARPRPAPDVDPRSIADMDDAGLSGLATRTGWARDTVAGLQGVDLRRPIDRIRRDTLKAMVGIYEGGKPPRNHVRIPRNRLMRDFKSASPAVRESMTHNQTKVLMDGIGDNGKRAVGDYTALKGKMRGLEGMNLRQLYDLKRGIMEDRGMAGRQRRNFAILVDKEIENSTDRGDTPRAEDAREATDDARRRRTARSPLRSDGEDAPDGGRPSTWQHPLGRLRDQRAETARKPKWGPVRLDGEGPVDGDAMARLMEDYPDLLDGGVPSGELNGWLLSRDGMVSRVQEAEARLKEVEAKEIKAGAAGEQVSDSPLYGSAGAKRALANAKGVLKEQDARILKRARELGLIHENREGVAWLPGVATPGVDSGPAAVSAIPFDAGGNVDTGRLRANWYYRRKDDGSVWYWTGKEMVDTRQKRDTSDLVVVNGELDRSLLVKGDIYKVEDGRYFQLDRDGENFVEMRRLVKSDRHGRAFARISSERAASRTADWAMPPALHGKGVRSEAEAIAEHTRIAAGRAGRGGYLATAIGTRAREVAEVKRQLDDARTYAAQRGISEKEFPRIAKLEKQYRTEMTGLRALQSKLMKEIEPEAVSVEEMAGRMNLPWWPEHARNAVIQELGDRISGAAEFAATVRAIGSNSWKEMFEKVEAGVPIDEIVPPSSAINPVRWALLDYKRFPKMWEQMERLYVGPLDARESSLYQWGEEMRGKIREAYPANPLYEGDFIVDLLPRLVDEAALSIGLWAALRNAEVAYALAEATVGAVDEGSTKFREALAQNKSIDEAYRMFGFGAVAGMAEGLPVAELLEKVNRATGGKLSGVLWELAKEGSEAALISTIQGALDEAAEKGLASEKEVAAVRDSAGVNQVVVSLVGSKR